MPAQLRRSRRLTTMRSRQNTPTTATSKTVLERSSVSGPHLPKSSPHATKASKLSPLKSGSNARSSPRISVKDTRLDSQRVSMKSLPSKKASPNKKRSPTKKMSPTKKSIGDEATVKRSSPKKSPKTPRRKVRVSLSDSAKSSSSSRLPRVPGRSSSKTSKPAKKVPSNLSKPLKHSKRSKSLSSVKSLQKSLVVVLDTPMVLKRFSAKRQLMTPDRLGSPSKAVKLQSPMESSGTPKKSTQKAMKRHSPMESGNTPKKRRNPGDSPSVLSQPLQDSKSILSTSSKRLRNKQEAVSAPTPRAPIAEIASRPSPEFSTPKSVCTDMPVEVSDYHVRRTFTRSSNRSNAKYTELSHDSSAVKSQTKLLVAQAKHSIDHREMDNGAPMTRARRAALASKTSVLESGSDAAVRRGSPVRSVAGVLCRCLVAALMVVMVAALLLSGGATLCRLHYMPTGLRTLCQPIRRLAARVAKWTGRM